MIDRNAERRLERLYREGGNIEPAAGLDRRIRARAEQSLTHRPTGRIPWLGGLVTASVAVMAIALVLQQSPPSPPAAPKSAAPEPHIADAPGNTAMQTEPLAADQPGEESTATRSFSAPAGEALHTPAYEPKQRAMPAPEARSESPAPDSRPQESPMEPFMVTGSRARMSDRLELDREQIAEEILMTRLRALIQAGHIAEARRLLEQTLEDGVELDLPEDIEQALRPQTGD